VNMPFPSSSNASLVLPPVLATTASSDDDLISIMNTESESIPKTESNLYSGIHLTTPSTSTVDSRLNHIEMISAGESDLPQISINPPEPTDLNPTLPPNTRLNTPIKVDISSPPFPPQPPPRPLPPFSSIQKAYPMADMKTDYCPPIFVRSLFWNWTRKGEIADQKCPGGATGLVKWECSYNPITKTTDWVPDRPDFSQCRSLCNLLDNAQDDAWLDLTVADRRHVASKLLKGLELSALLLADNTNQDGSFAVAKPNVLVSVHVLDTRMPISLQFPTVEDTRGTIEWIRMEDSLFLPAQALLEYSKDGLAKVAFLAYYRIEDLLKPDVYSINDKKDEKSLSYSMFNRLQNITSTSLAINSRVIGAALSNGRAGDQKNIQLSQPIAIILRHIQEENVSNPKCVYWDVERRDWLSEGCWMESTNATHTVCMCNHLTHFALLMDIRPIDLLVPENNWQKLVVIIGCAIAMLSLVFVSTIVCVVSAGNTEAVSIHRNLCVTLLIVEMTYLIGIYRTDIPLLCGLTAGSLHFFLLSTLLWTFLESIDLYLNLIDMYESVKSAKRLIWYYMIAYGGPALIILIALLIDPSSYGTQTHCWLRTDNYFYLSFVGPAIGIVFGGLVFVLISCFVVLNNSNTSTTIKCIEETKLDVTRNGIKWVVVLLILQGLTWTFGLIHTNVQTSNTIALFFTILNISLGVFVSLFCIIKTDNIQHHRLVRGLPFLAFCFEDINCSTTKTTATVSDSYTNRPVVTQVTATQVAGIAQHQQLQQSLQSLPPCPQLMSSQIDDNSSTPLDRPYISAQRQTNTLYTSRSGTTGPILVNPINSIPNINMSVSDINAAALVSHNFADYETKLQQIRHNSLSRQPKPKRKIRVNHNNHLDDTFRYGMHSNIPSQMHSNLYNQYIEHIYESIDSDSLGSGVYGQQNRFSRRQPAVMSRVNDFYSGANITVNPTADDDWSQNSSSSCGPLYDERPLLIANQSINNSPNINQPFISQEFGSSQVHHNSNLNIYDKSRDEMRSFRNNCRIKNFESSGQHMTMPSNASNMTAWNIYPTSSEGNSDLPDLVQDPIDASNNITTVFVGGSNAMNIRHNMNSDIDANTDSTQNQTIPQFMSSSQNVKYKAYC
ncbi:unnamed protein product, partial [Medioppia subpectinata]